jgi:hypothetical protein
MIQAHAGHKKHMETKRSDKAFKVCPCCQKTFYSEKDLHEGCNYIGNMSEEIACFNCLSCGSTLAIKTTLTPISLNSTGFPN